MKKFLKEFKTFITRGNVMDMAVGVIIGGAFTAIVTALTTNVLQPLINWFLAAILGGNGDALSAAVTVLRPSYVDGVLDLATSIYINWGAFIAAIINFILVALVLFMIIKLFNSVRSQNDKLKSGLKDGKLTKEQKKELKANGIKASDKEGAKKYFDEKNAKAEAEKAEAEKEAKLKAEAERLANPTAEDLLKDIKALLEAKAK